MYDLPKRIQLHKPKVIVISGLLDQFYQDPYINFGEAESSALQIVTSLHKIKDVFINQLLRLNHISIFFLIRTGLQSPDIPILSLRCKSKIESIFLRPNVNLSRYSCLNYYSSWGAFNFNYFQSANYTSNVVF